MEQITVGLNDIVTKLGYAHYLALYKDWSHNYTPDKAGISSFAVSHNIFDELAEKLINNARFLYE